MQSTPLSINSHFTKQAKDLTQCGTPCSAVKNSVAFKGGPSIMELSEQEEELIKILRENSDADGFRLFIERQDGAWEIAMTVPLLGRGGKVRLKKGRGVGLTFEHALDNALGVRF